FEELGDDRTGASVWLDLGPISEGIFFGCPIHWPEDTSPRVEPILKTEEDIRKFVKEWRIPDPAEHKGVQEVYRLCERFRERAENLGLKEAGVGIPSGCGLQIHPPLSCACAIADKTTVFELMLTDKDLIRRLFSKLLACFLVLQEFHDRYNRTKTESIGLADDDSAFVSDELYRELVMPYNLTIYERYGKRWRYLHADGPNDHHFRTYAEIMRINEMDIGGFSDIANAKREMHGKTVIFGGLNNKDLYGGFEEARPKVERAIRIGAPGGGYIFGIGGETYVGTDPDVLCRVVEHARKVGKYPKGGKMG
ncbi:MAG TPA: hypothetical protein EYP65_01080, partial [Armatimonadetes bacterium]|nr:hypothetical protein [Armatimonadota bacterium]